MATDLPDGLRTGWRKTRSAYRPAVGRAFEVDEIDAEIRWDESRTRNHIARTILWCAVAAVAIAAGLAAYQGSATPLVTIWAIVGPFAGGMIAYYFTRDAKE